MDKKNYLAFAFAIGCVSDGFLKSEIYNAPEIGNSTAFRIHSTGKRKNIPFDEVLDLNGDNKYCEEIFRKVLGLETGNFSSVISTEYLLQDFARHYISMVYANYSDKLKAMRTVDNLKKLYHEQNVGSNEQKLIANASVFLERIMTDYTRNTLGLLNLTAEQLNFNNDKAVKENLPWLRREKCSKEEFDRVTMIRAMALTYLICNTDVRIRLGSITTMEETPYIGLMQNPDNISTPLSKAHYLHDRVGAYEESLTLLEEVLKLNMATLGIKDKIEGKTQIERIAEMERISLPALAEKQPTPVLPAIIPLSTLRTRTSFRSKKLADLTVLNLMSLSAISDKVNLDAYDDYVSGNVDNVHDAFSDNWVKSSKLNFVRKSIEQPCKYPYARFIVDGENVREMKHLEFLKNILGMTDEEIEEYFTDESDEDTMDNE